MLQLISSTCPTSYAQLSQVASGNFSIITKKFCCIVLAEEKVYRCMESSLEKG